MKYREMKRQPRAKAMLPAIKELITIRSLEDRQKDRTLLAYELIEEIQDKFPKEISPTHATLIKKISEARSKHETSPLDKPWSLAVLNHLHELNIFDFNADAVEHILKVQCFVDKEVRKFFTPKNIEKSIKDIIRDNPTIDKSVFTEEWKTKYMTQVPFLTIRQAKWVSRFYRLYSKITGGKKYIGRLYFTALIYANYEIVSEISGTKFDTTHLDRLVLNYSDFAPLVKGYFAAMRFDQAIYEAWMRSFTNISMDKGEDK